MGAGIQGLRNLPVFGLTTDPHPIWTLFLCPEMEECPRLFNEDCLETMRKMSDNEVMHCITSPPYNINLRIHSGKYTKQSVKERTKYDGSFCDALPMEEYFEWQKKVISEMLRVSSGLVFYNIQMLTGNKVALMKLLGHFAYQIKEIIIWDKVFCEPSMSDRVLNSSFEFIIIFDKNNSISRQFDFAGFERGKLSNVFRIKKNGGNSSSETHSAAFPRSLPYLLIKNFTRDGESVYDPFMGTGTVGTVCVELKRVFIGSEINEAYFQIAKRNINNKVIEPELF